MVLLETTILTLAPIPFDIELVNGWFSKVPLTKFVGLVAIPSVNLPNKLLIPDPDT